MRINPAVVLAIDPGATSGFALLGPSHLDRRWSGVTKEDDAATRLSVTQTAIDLARREQLPLVVAREKWSAGGPHATPTMFAGLGARWGWWQESIRLAQQLVRSSRALKVVHVQVFTQTWWAAVVGGRKPKRDAALRIVVRAMTHCYGLDEDIPSDDEAVALAIARWAQTAADVRKALPARAWSADGDWISRSGGE